MRLALMVCLLAGTVCAADLPGPKVGEKLPPLAVSDQDGKVRDYDSIKGPKGAMIVFYRSADW